MGLNPHRIVSTSRLTADTPAAVLYRVVEDEAGVRCIPELLPLPEGEKLVTMQRAVGGNVEHIPIGASRHRKFVVYDGWVNEEGLLVDLPFGVRLRAENGAASVLISCAGSVLITAAESLSGETVALTPDEVHDLVLITMSAGELPVISLSPENPDA